MFIVDFVFADTKLCFIVDILFAEMKRCWLLHSRPSPDTRRYSCRKCRSREAFLYVRWIHNLHGNRRAPDLLSDLAAISVHSPRILVSKTDICNAYMIIQPRRMQPRPHSNFAPGSTLS